MQDTGAVVHLPPVLIGSGAAPHYAVEGLVDTGHEPGPVSKPVRPCRCAVGHGKVAALLVNGHKLLAFVHVHLALPGGVVAGHAPTGVDGYGWDWYVPSHTEPSASTGAAVGKGKGRLHALPPRGNVEGIAQRRRAVVVRRGRLHDCLPAHRVGGLEVAHHRGYEGLGFWHLGGFQNLVDEVCEMGRQRHYLVPGGVNGDTLQTHPRHRSAVVVGGVYVVGGVPFWDAGWVIGHAQLSGGAEVLAGGQQAVARGGGGHVLHALRQGWQIPAGERRDAVITAVSHRAAMGDEGHAPGLNSQGAPFQGSDSLVGRPPRLWRDCGGGSLDSDGGCCSAVSTGGLHGLLHVSAAAARGEQEGQQCSRHGRYRCVSLHGFSVFGC